MDNPRILFVSSPSSSAAVAPALDAYGPVPEDIDRALGVLARRVQHGDVAAQDALYSAFLPRLQHWIVDARRRLSWHGSDPALEPDDIAQEAFVVFADLVRKWHGRGSLSAYVIACFNWRLKDAVSAMSDRRQRTGLDMAPYALLADGSHAADEAMQLMDEIARGLNPRQATVLRLRVRDELPWQTIANQMGVNRRTVLRDWRAIRELVFSQLLIDL